jgi:hypothetical protein
VQQCRRQLQAAAGFLYDYKKLLAAEVVGELLKAWKFESRYVKDNLIILDLDWFYHFEYMKIKRERTVSFFC